jgi:molecular chaperone GrpE (heat shock protein)
MSESHSPEPAAPADIGEAGPEPDCAPISAPASEPAVVIELEPTDDAAEPLDQVLAVLERLEDRLEESQRLLARQTEIATSLHAENQRLRAGELRRAQLPLVRDLIRVQDVFRQLLDAAVETTAAADLQISRDSILDALARNGIEQIRGEPGDPLDPRVHNVVGVEPADDAAGARTISEVVRCGFVWEDGTAIRAADVRVWKHTPKVEAPGSPDTAADI